MPFKVIGSLNPHGGPLLKRYTANNSIVLTELDVVENTTEFLALGTSANPLVGNVMSIVTFDGLGVTDNGSGGAFSNTYTLASNNTTVAQIGARVDISKETLYSAELSATIGSTTGSDLPFYKMDLTDEDTLDETSALTGTSSLQYLTHGTDPANTAQAVVSLFESVIFGPLG